MIDTHTVARAALSELIDYAGLFPPATLGMAQALEAYASHRASPYAWMLGRFIVPASRLGELPAAAPIGLSVIIDAPAGGWLEVVGERFGGLRSFLAGTPGFSVASIEAALPPLRSMRESYDAAVGQFAAARAHAGFASVPAFLEVPRDGRRAAELPGALEAMRRHALGAKVRCGGVTAEAFPSLEELAQFVVAAIRAKVRFKATAGLHHPLRRIDPTTGFAMHGFLNLIAATAAALEDAEEPRLEALLAAERIEELSLADATLMERLRSEAFAGYGSCSFDEPVEDLRGLGVLQ